MRSSSSTASSSSKSPSGTAVPYLLRWSDCSTRLTLRRLIVVRLDVVLPDPVHVNQVGRAYCAGWRAGDDDHQIAALVAAELQQGFVDLPDHSVGGLDVRHDECL